jgi:hypothetical protein
MSNCGYREIHILRRALKNSERSPLPRIESEVEGTEGEQLCTELHTGGFTQRSVNTQLGRRIPIPVHAFRQWLEGKGAVGSTAA